MMDQFKLAFLSSLRLSFDRTKHYKLAKKHDESYGLGLYIWGLFDESAMWWVIGSVIKLVLGSLLWLVMGQSTSVKCDQFHEGFYVSRIDNNS